MARAELSEAIIQELGAVFMAAVQEAAPELLSTDLDGIERAVASDVPTGVGANVDLIVA